MVINGGTVDVFLQRRTQASELFLAGGQLAAIGLS